MSGDRALCLQNQSDSTAYGAEHFAPTGFHAELLQMGIFAPPSRQGSLKEAPGETTEMRILAPPLKQENLQKATSGVVRKHQQAFDPVAEIQSAHTTDVLQAVERQKNIFPPGTATYEDKQHSAMGIAEHERAMFGNPGEGFSFAQFDDDIYKSQFNVGGKTYNPVDILAEVQNNMITDKISKPNTPGEYVTVETEHGKLKVPAGNPVFGLPTNFVTYSKNVDGYVKWMETWSGESYGWNHMTSTQKEDFANGLRHALGIGNLVFQGMPPEMVINTALGHEAGDTSLDSRQDRHNNIWAAHTANKMAREGKTWFDFVAKATYAAADAAFYKNGFLK